MPGLAVAAPDRVLRRLVDAQPLLVQRLNKRPMREGLAPMMVMVSSGARHDERFCGVTQWRIGDRIALRAREYQIEGFTPMSVLPCRVQLRDVVTGERSEALEEELAPAPVADFPRAHAKR